MQSLGGKFGSHVADRRSDDRHNGRRRRRPDAGLWINERCAQTLHDGSQMEPGWRTAATAA